MNSADKVELAELRLAGGRITQAEFDKVMTEVMWTQVGSEQYYYNSYHAQSIMHYLPTEETLDRIKAEVVKSLGYWMDEETKDKYDTNTYMYSESHSWYCYVKEPNVYWLFNGEWGAYVDGDDSEIMYRKHGSPENEHVVAADWIEVTGAWMAKECGYFYRTRPQSNLGDWEDDDIDF